MGMPEEASHPAKTDSPVPQALSRALHFGIPIASILVLLAFAWVLFLPEDKATIPPTSTQIYIPIYLLIVIIFVFASMYLFKRILDTDVPESFSES